MAWRVPSVDILSRSLNVAQTAGYLLEALSVAGGRPLDELYSKISSINGHFFPKGWGNLRVVNYEEDLKYILQWPPVGIKVGQAGVGVRGGEELKCILQ